MKYTCLMTTFNYRVRGTCVPTRAFHAQLACLIGRYNVKGELDCFNCKTVFSSDSSLQCLQKKEIAIHVFPKKNQIIYGEYLTIISVPKVIN